jgi:hypothetical protein
VEYGKWELLLVKDTLLHILGTSSGQNELVESIIRVRIAFIYTPTTFINLTTFPFLLSKMQNPTIPHKPMRDNI